MSCKSVAGVELELLPMLSHNQHKTSEIHHSPLCLL